MQTRGKNKGKYKGSSTSSSTKEEEGAPTIKVVYLESDFECSCPVVTDDLSAALEAAQTYGIEEASKVTKLPFKSLSARPLGPLVQSDGSPYNAREWARLFMVAVETTKPGHGLMARNAIQKQLTDHLLTAGVEDVKISGPPLISDRELLKENADLKEKNATLKSELLLLEQKYSGLQVQLSQNPLSQQVSSLQQQNSSLSNANSALVSQISTLSAENAALLRENRELTLEKSILQQTVASLELRVTVLEAQMARAQTALNAMGTFDKVLIRKMVEQCRRRAKDLAASANLHVLPDWNAACLDPTFMALLNQHGLNIGLIATLYGSNTPQAQGNQAAHTITEDVDIYAYAICKMKEGPKRDRMVNIFEFLFNKKPEQVNFSDDDNL